MDAYQGSNKAKVQVLFIRRCDADLVAVERGFDVSQLQYKVLFSRETQGLGNSRDCSRQIRNASVHAWETQATVKSLMPGPCETQVQDTLMQCLSPVSCVLGLT